MLELNLEGAPPRQPTTAEINFQAALLAALMAVVLSLILRYGFGAPLVPELLSQFIFATLPISIIEFGVGLLGPFAKQLAFVGCFVVYGAGLLALALPFLNRNGRAVLSAVSLSLVSWFLVLLLVFPLLGEGLFGWHLRQGMAASCAWMLLISLFYGADALLLRELFRRGSSTAAAGETSGLYQRLSRTVIERRRIASWIGYVIIGVALYDIGRALLPLLFTGGAGRVRHGNGVFPDIDGLALELTPTSDFYQVSKNASDPAVDAARWRLQITGLVESPLSFSFDEIQGLPSVEQYATLECISNEVGGDLVSSALWQGVRLKDLLQKAVPKPGVVTVVLRAADGYTDSIPLERAQADGTILAYRMNGMLLDLTHGFPVRLIAPGIYGMKNVKWVTGVELINHDYKGYWQARGWDNRAEYKTMSRIDTPTKTIGEKTTVAGVAFAGDRGISKVEVSTDGGKTWEAADLTMALSAYTWVLWHKDWMPESKGPKVLVVRATDGRGVTQTSEHAPPIPDGASGYDVRRIDVA
jgi:hypothetical protein